jgi:phosphate uptake regulator
MSRRLTAADRTALIRLASTMPVGFTERRAILAAVKENTTLFRDAYYRMGDGVVSMQEAARDSKDRDLIRLMSKVNAAVDAVHRHLEQHYIWD